jgi:hypothetical protein
LAVIVIVALHAAGADAALVDAPRLPRWSSRLRTGAPGAATLWPFDGELAALRLGRRALLKRECFSDAAAAADRAWLAAAGLTVSAVGAIAADGRRVLLAARGAIDPALIAAEHALQRAATRGGPRARRGARLPARVASTRSSPPPATTIARCWPPSPAPPRRRRRR